MPERATLFVCTTCSHKSAADGKPIDTAGADLVAVLEQRLARDPEAAGIEVAPVECLAVCRRPATIALAAAGKWTYLIGDLDAGAHLEDIVAAAKSYRASADGIVPWRERPQTFRKGVIARVPPLGFKQPVTRP